MDEAQIKALLWGLWLAVMLLAAVLMLFGVATVIRGYFFFDPPFAKLMAAGAFVTVVGLGVAAVMVQIPPDKKERW